MSVSSSATNSSDFSLVSDFHGYRNKEDVTNLPPGYLVVGSQNVLTTTSGRVSLREGYTLDGQSSATIAPVLSSFDWDRHTGDQRNLRSGNLVAGNDGKLQVRYVANAGDYYNGTTFTAGQVYWLDLMTNLTSTRFNFCDFWSTTEVKSFLLMVNNTPNIYQWTGCIETAASFTASTVTKNGTNTWAQDGLHQTLSSWGDTTTVWTITNPVGTTFKYAYVSGTNPNIVGSSAPLGTTVIITATGFNVNNRGTFTITGIGAGYFEVTNASGVAEASKTVTGGGISYDYNYNNGTGWNILVNGTTYNYLGGALTTTLTGVSPSPAAEPAQSIVMQKVDTFANSGTTTGLPTTFNNGLIECLKNRVYIGDFTNQNVFASKVNSFTDFGYTSPVHLVNEGALLTLDACPIGFKPQEDTMYIWAGKDYIYQITWTLSSDLSKESFTVSPLKTGPRQSAQSQSLIGRVKNDIFYVTHEPTIDSIGRVAGVISTPQTTNISDPIKLDFNTYNFTDGNVKYFRNFVYVSIPKQGIVRVWNIEKGWWEAPQLLPVSCFSIINGELYGHSYQVNETYKLFSGYNDNGNPIDARAYFSYQNFGTRSASKYFNEFYIEGYIQGNSTLTLSIQYEIDGKATNTAYSFKGVDKQIVAIRKSDSYLGADSLGKNPLGGDSVQYGVDPLPPKFRGIKTFPRKDFYECQIGFLSYGKDYRWEILAFGPLVTRSTFGNNDIKF